MDLELLGDGRGTVKLPVMLVWWFAAKINYPSTAGQGTEMATRIAPPTQRLGDGAGDVCSEFAQQCRQGRRPAFHQHVKCGGELSL